MAKYILLEVKQEIEFWRNFFDNSKEINQEVIDRLYETAFIKIYIKFEKCFIQIFLDCIDLGGKFGSHDLQSYLSYPSNEYGLEKLLKTAFGNSYYLNFDKIKDLHPLLINKRSSPFENIFTSIDSSKLKQMTRLRNYYAHESQESKEKYRRTFFKQNHNLTSEEENISFVLNQSLHGKHKTRYQDYIELLEIMINILEDIELNSPSI